MDLKADLEAAQASETNWKDRAINVKNKLIKWKKPIIISAATLFVIGNIALIFSSNSEAARSTYLKDWTTSEKQTLKETFTTLGVVTPMKEHYVYYNDNPGEFKEFLVAKGDSVRRGTPLYEYSTKNIDTDKQKLEFEKSQLIREANIIDEHIQQLLYLQSVSNSAQNNGGTTNDGETDSTTSTGEIVTVSIEKEIYDKQLEKGRILNEIKKYDEIINSMNNGDQLGIHSDVEGIVKEINYELKNPIMTIISKTPRIEGTFTEEELKVAKEGMHVELTSPLLDEKLTGTITDIADYPEETPSVEEKSKFPFVIELDNEEDKLIKGTHVEVTVITDEVLNAVTAPANSIVKKDDSAYLFVVTITGNIEKREITQGLKVKGNVEIEDGLEENQVIIKKPSVIKQEDASFITPLNPKHLSKQPFSEEDEADLLKYISVGFLKR